MDPLVVDRSRLDSELRSAFHRAKSVSALYLDRDEDGDIVVFAVVPEHDDPSYLEVLAAEDEVRRRLPEEGFETRVRAHQARAPRAGVGIPAMLACLA